MIWLLYRFRCYVSRQSQCFQTELSVVARSLFLQVFEFLDEGLSTGRIIRVNISTFGLELLRESRNPANRATVHDEKYGQQGGAHARKC